MNCEERLSHAIEIDKIKIYPNHNLIVEKTKRKNIGESHEKRKESKEKNNEYTYWNTLDDENEEEYAHFDSEKMHNEKISDQDETFYFALADCEGHLEIFEDEEKREHLLGLSALWEDIKDEDYDKFENKNKKGMDMELRQQMHDAEEAQGIMDTTDPNSIQDAMQSIEDMRSERNY